MSHVKLLHLSKHTMRVLGKDKEFDSYLIGTTISVLLWILTPYSAVKSL